MADYATFNNLGNAYTLNDNGGGETLTVNSGLTVNGTAGVTINAGLVGGASGLTIDGAGDLTIAGDITGGNGLIKNGTGTTTVTGANSAPGNTTVNEGTIGVG